MLQGSHGMAGGKEEAHPVVGYLLKGFGLKPGSGKNRAWFLDLGTKKENPPDVNALGLQWANLLDHWVLLTTGERETSISLLQKTQGALPTHLTFFP